MSVERRRGPSDVSFKYLSLGEKAVELTILGGILLFIGTLAPFLTASTGGAFGGSSVTQSWNLWTDNSGIILTGLAVGSVALAMTHLYVGLFITSALAGLDVLYERDTVVSAKSSLLGAFVQLDLGWAQWMLCAGTVLIFGGGIVGKRSGFQSLMNRRGLANSPPAETPPPFSPAPSGAGTAPSASSPALRRPPPKPVATAPTMDGFAAPPGPEPSAARRAPAPRPAPAPSAASYSPAGGGIPLNFVQHATPTQPREPGLKNVRRICAQCGNVAVGLPECPICGAPL